MQNPLKLNIQTKLIFEDKLVKLVGPRGLFHPFARFVLSGAFNFGGRQEWLWGIWKDEEWQVRTCSAPCTPKTWVLTFSVMGNKFLPLLWEIRGLEQTIPKGLYGSRFG